jgi:hypothetical protein
MGTAPVRIVALTFCALYFPLVYGLVYVPLIVPRLAGWDSIPLLVLVGIAVPFVAFAVVFGSASTQRGLIFGAVGIAAVNSVAIAIVAGAGWPGFHDVVNPLTETLPAFFIAIGGGALIFGEVGFALQKAFGRRSPSRA